MKTSSVKKIEPISRMYAKALFEFSKESGNLGAVEKDLPEFIHTFFESDKLSSILSSKTISAQERLGFFREVSKKTELNKILSNFLEILIEKDRFFLLDEISRAFQTLVDQQNNIVRGTVVSAEPLSESQTTDLSKAFGKKLGKNVVLEQQIDKDILGGLVVKVQGKVFDGSLKTTIQRLKENLERQSL